HQYDLFKFNNTVAGSVLRLRITKTSLADGYGNYRIFPRDASGARYLGAVAGLGLLPGAPTGLTATAQNSTRIHLAWVDNFSGETGVEVWASEDGGAYALVTTRPPNAVAFNHIGLSGNHTYSYRVRAIAAAGWTDFSN